MSDERAPRGYVTLGFPSSQAVEPHTSISLLETALYDQIHGGRHFHPRQPQLSVVGSGFITNARNELVKRFLSMQDPEPSEWLLMVDDDQVYPFWFIDVLMASADAQLRPIVGLPVWRFKEDGPPDGRVKVIRNIYTDLDEFGHFIELDGDLPPNTVMQVAGIGSGCLLIHRSALLTMRDTAVASGLGPTFCWFQQTVQPVMNEAGQLVSDHVEGEDMHFCRLAGVSGLPIFINTSITLDHIKPTRLTSYDQIRSYGKGAVAADPALAEPADERVAVMVPVLNRPQNAEPFMRSLRASTGLATVYALCSEEADADAWTEAGATVVATEGTTFAEKVNEGYPWTDEPWLLLVGDDVRFHPGWLDHALAEARRTGARLVGTNDLGNPRVLSGEHATHPLIARSYIDEVGAAWDYDGYGGPGVVCCEAYRHWFCDDEWTAAAKQRGEFTVALSSVIEHLHPIWGKSEDDDTYRLGQKAAGRDRLTFMRRLKANQKVAA